MRARMVAGIVLAAAAGLAWAGPKAATSPAEPDRLTAESLAHQARSLGHLRDGAIVARAGRIGVLLKCAASHAPDDPGVNRQLVDFHEMPAIWARRRPPPGDTSGLTRATTPRACGGFGWRSRGWTGPGIASPSWRRSQPTSGWQVEFAPRLPPASQASASARATRPPPAGPAGRRSCSIRTSLWPWRSTGFWRPRPARPRCSQRPWPFSAPSAQRARPLAGGRAAPGRGQLQGGPGLL